MDYVEEEQTEEEEFIGNVKRPSLLSLNSSDEDEYQFDYVPESKTSTPATTIPDELGAPLQEAAVAYSISKSKSMHDVSFIPLPLRRGPSRMLSNESLNSNSIQSKDSGFQRSTSCTSLAGAKKYDHVQSKVKQYIQNLKQSEAVNRMHKRLSVQEKTDLSTPEPPNAPSKHVSVEELISKVKRLEEDIKERDFVIREYEKNKIQMELKYAAAENCIDDLTIKATFDPGSQNKLIGKPSPAVIPMNYQSQETLKRSVSFEDHCEDSGVSSYTPKRFVEKKTIMLQKIPAKPTMMTTTPRLPLEMSPSTATKCTERPMAALQPVKKFCSNSVKLNEGSFYPLARIPPQIQHQHQPLHHHHHHRQQQQHQPNSILKSNSYGTPTKDVRNKCSLDKSISWKGDMDVLNSPYDSLSKVRQWQRTSGFYSGGKSLAANGNECSDRAKVGGKRESANNNNNNNNNNKKCPAVSPRGGRKLMRSVSFVSYGYDSMASSLYDDDDDSSSDGSSSDSNTSALFVPKKETYQEFKERKQRERMECKFTKGEIWKTKSAANVRDTFGNSNKRTGEESVAGCSNCSCSEGAKHSAKCSKGSKQLKLNDCRILSNVLVKCRTTHLYLGGGDDVLAKSKSAAAAAAAASAFNNIHHSKSFDALKKQRKSDRELSGKSGGGGGGDCKCLTALEKLKIKEKESLEGYKKHLSKSFDLEKRRSYK